MPSYPHIEKYHADLARLRQFAGSANEQTLRRAFAVCLSSYCRAHPANLELVEELRYTPGIIPDGTIKDPMRLPRGYWEAKDLHDNLDAEIRRKRDRGYPDDNILYENSQHAVLIQRGTIALRADMRHPASLHRIIQQFLNHETPEVEQFRQAWLQFKHDLPNVLDNLRKEVASAAAQSDNYKVAAAGFLSLCQRTISPRVSEFDVQEMLIQHTLTKDIFLRVFSEDQFHQENNIARQLDALERSFFTGDARRETLNRLLPYYTAITAAAVSVSDYREKQRFLKAVYQDFYQAYNPAAADRLGVVYTPNEVVDFIIRGADHLLQTHFGRRLADNNVQILDPAAGTGTFVTGLIDYLPADRLEYKYRHEIHANEVAILPYYIANLNIEYTYQERSGRYLEFPNLCFVDTLDNHLEPPAAAQTAARQPAFNLGALSEENWIRVQEQNEKPISVIIGNPPYNDSQTNWNDFNPNRAYPEVDRRIRETYVAASNAQKTHQYDMYKRFIRWASDRLDHNGIIAFITNRSYIDSRQDDGFRQVVLDEFSDLYIIDLGGDIRKGRPAGNIFGIMTGVAIGFLVKSAARHDDAGIHYHTLTDSHSGPAKLAELAQLDFASIPFRDITPDANANWLNHSSNRFASLMPIASKQTKFAKSPDDEKAVFALFTNGSKSNRDAWVYDFDADNLRKKTQFFANTYNGLLDRGETTYDPAIKWSSSLRDKFERKERIAHNDANIIETMYRPFVVMRHYTHAALNDRLTRNHYEIFGPDLQQPNRVICFCVNGKDFHVLATDKLPDFHLTGDSQCLPLYRYTPDGQRVNNITDWALQKINEHCRKDLGQDYHKYAGENGFGAEDLFAYVYAVLHDPDYLYTYETDLRREFPRLPLYRDFDQWVKIGQELLDLHLGFETAEPYPLERIEKPGPPGKPILRADKTRGAIILDSQTTLTGIPEDAWRYRLGRRSALEWALDQHKERPPKDPTIRQRFNPYRFADHKERVIDLLHRICAVSVNTADMVGSMAYWDDEVDRLVVFGDRDSPELGMLALWEWFQRPEYPEWGAEWSGM